MSDIRSLSFMCGCLRDVIDHSRNDEIREGIEAAIRTLEWMQKGELVLKELMRLRKEEPELFETLRRLIGMGARLSDIRATEQLAEEAGL